ncbi:hypothetical protein TSOC_006369 [Tetrabaena socialis]|uniref:Uncharacterized protein n=1 Tax=Tetrabaena socialis TaxID=47790 RepID=A0A2J8A3T8_9CHLO|nr:hypothetical protein TSOC_006369 [Tetrabaena socialis]|eukprot:PNH07192.1 hypothetical protein TSOC_006369 [Tetrabaena socialis]
MQAVLALGRPKSVRAWRAWEDAAHAQHRDGDVKTMTLPARWLYWHVGSNPVIHWIIMLVRQYQISVNQTMYHNARLMFIEKMGLPYDFDFHGLVVVSLEEELARTGQQQGTVELDFTAAAAAAARPLGPAPPSGMQPSVPRSDPSSPPFGTAGSPAASPATGRPRLNLQLQMPSEGGGGSDSPGGLPSVDTSRTWSGLQTTHSQGSHGHGGGPSAAKTVLNAIYRRGGQGPSALAKNRKRDSGVDATPRGGPGESGSPGLGAGQRSRASPGGAEGGAGDRV